MYCIAAVLPGTGLLQRCCCCSNMPRSPPSVPVSDHAWCTWPRILPLRTCPQLLAGARKRILFAPLGSALCVLCSFVGVRTYVLRHLRMVLSLGRKGLTQERVSERTTRGLCCSLCFLLRNRSSVRKPTNSTYRGDHGKHEHHQKTGNHFVPNYPTTGKLNRTGLSTGDGLTFEPTS